MMTPPTNPDAEELRKDRELWGLAQNITNQILDLSKLTVEERQAINDKCDEFVMRLLSRYIQKECIVARIDERKNVNLPFAGDHSQCLDARGCIGYQNAESDLANENELRVEALTHQKESLEKEK